MTRMRGLALAVGIVGALAAFGASSNRAAAAQIKIGYSDWPGWVAWDVAINKGWLKQAGLDVDFEWFDYSASMDAFSAGKLDGVFVTNGDELVMGGGGTKSVGILLTDYSAGNDEIVAKPGITSLKQLKGQKVGIEVGLVEHLLLLNGLARAGMSADDVTLVNTKTNDTPQVLASGQVAAIGAWQPNSGMAMQALPGSKPIYTSADAPGLIYDILAVNPASLNANKADYAKLLKVSDKVVHYINDPATQDDAIKIMAARDGLTSAVYKPLLKGTHLIDIAEAKKVFVKGNTLSSVYGSSAVADDFNVKNDVYKDKQDVGSYLDPSLTMAQ